MEIVKKGNLVKVEYTGKLEDGTIFDSSDQHEAPLEFMVGSGSLIKGFEDAVVGMKVGEEEITLNPEEAYGQHNPELIRKIPKESFPEDQEVSPGMMFMMSLPNGRQIPVRISEIEEDSVTVDLNSPLAGKTLIFKIKIVEIIE